MRHVTLLSTINGDRAPHEVDIAAVEDDLAPATVSRIQILRPGVGDAELHRRAPAHHRREAS